MQSATPLRRPTILCIDDRISSLHVRKILLERQGYTVFLASSPAEGLTVLAQSRVDLVVLDYNFPGGNMNGELLARRIRELHPDVKTVMLSGMPDVPPSAVTSVDAFCMKGRSPLDLLQVISELIPSGRKLPARVTPEQVIKKSRELIDQSMQLRQKYKRKL
jgi:CheY-like chemotaxis protein